MKERREHERHRVYRFGVRVATREAFRASYLRDLSRGGVFVRSKSPLPLGAPVAIELTPPDHPPLSLRGKVVRREENGFGVQFDPLGADAQRALDAVVADYERGAAPAEPSAVELKAELADLKGSVEAYEEELSRLRESESDLTARLELAEHEKAALAAVAQELKERLGFYEAEYRELAGKLSTAAAQVSTLQAQVLEQTQRNEALVREMAASHELYEALEADHAEELKAQLEALRKKSKAELDAAVAQKARLAAELRTVQQSLKETSLDRLREELRVATSELDEERMKGLALKQALERFVAMGGKR